MLTIKWTEKHSGAPNTRSDYRQIDGNWLGTLCRIDDRAGSGRWNWVVFTDDEEGVRGTADDEAGAKEAARLALWQAVLVELEAAGMQVVAKGVG